MKFISDNLPPMMFAGMILFMLIGYPAAFSLAATGLLALGDTSQASIGLILESAGSRIAYTPSLPEVSEALLAVYDSCDAILVDGTFWSDAELRQTHDGTPLARSIGHLPMSGSEGTICLLKQVKRPKKVFIHINNTNPVLDHPDDWSVAIAIEYKNWATIDEMSEKANAIVEKHYGSRQAMIDAGKKRNEISPTLRSTLAREVTLK